MALVATFAVWPVAGAEAAPQPESGTLASAEATVTWKGTLPNDGHDIFRVDVNLPAGVWNQPGGVQFGVKWPYVSNEQADLQDLDLYVYDKFPDGEVDSIAFSNGTDEDSESLTLDKPKNGTYWVLVHGFRSKGYEYRGRIEVERPLARDPVRDLLPDLVSQPQSGVRLPGTRRVRPGDPDSKQLTNGCLPEEQAEQGASRCLRFDQIIGNFGDGPTELRYSAQDLNREQNMFQVIHKSDGTTHRRIADRYEYHATHEHFHYANFAQSHIWQSDAGGARLGDAPLRSGKKNGFCLIDVLDLWFDRKGGASRGYWPDGCISAEDIESGREGVNGISRGWADVYNWWLPDQYIDVAGVPDGYYQLETVVDPKNTLVETNDGNNSGAISIQICGEKVETAGGQDVCSGPPPAAVAGPPPTQEEPPTGKEPPSKGKPPSKKNPPSKQPSGKQQGGKSPASAAAPDFSWRSGAGRPPAKSRSLRELLDPRLGNRAARPKRGKRGRRCRRPKAGKRTKLSVAVKKKRRCRGKARRRARKALVRLM